MLHHVFWCFFFEAEAAIRDQFIGSESCTGLKYYTRHHEFSPLWISYPVDRHFPHRGMLVDSCFDLAGVNIFTAGNNHVFQTIQQIEVTFGILIADVAGTKHSITEGEVGFLRIVPISTHDVCAASNQFACLSNLNFFPRVVDNADVDARTRAAARRQSSLRMFMVLQPSKEARLT